VEWNAANGKRFEWEEKWEEKWAVKWGENVDTLATNNKWRSCHFVHKFALGYYFHCTIAANSTLRCTSAALSHSRAAALAHFRTLSLWHSVILARQCTAAAKLRCSRAQVQQS